MIQSRSGTVVSGAAFQRQKDLLESNTRFLKADLEKFKEEASKLQEELRTIRTEKANLENSYEAEKVF